MDKQAILKLFNDNATSKTEPQQESIQELNNGNMVIQYGDNSIATTGCSVDNNNNLSTADKQQVHDLIHSLEQRNRANKANGV